MDFLNEHSNTNSNVSSPQQSATSSITESPDSFDMQSTHSTHSTHSSQSLNNELTDNNINIRDFISRIDTLEQNQKRSIAIDKLYQLINAVEPYLVAKITGMIIHKQSTENLLKLLMNEQLLNTKISQATKILTTRGGYGSYHLLYHDIKHNCHSTKEKMKYLHNKLYPKVEEYVSQKNLADIITDMLLQLNISEIFVLLNQDHTLKQRMNEAIKVYLEANAVHIHAINEYQNHN